MGVPELDRVGDTLGVGVPELYRVGVEVAEAVFVELEDEDGECDDV